MATLTDKQAIKETEDFISDIQDQGKSYYVYVGKPTPWNDDANPDVANDSIQQTELSVYSDMVYGKIIGNTDVQFMIPNYTWTNNTPYSAYSHTDSSFMNQPYYVLTDEGSVFKCIYNGAGANSTIKPSLKSTIGVFETGDGYIWKYMYTIDMPSNTKFTTASYIPCLIDANVQSNAVPGTIDYLKLSNPGVNYQVYEEGFISNLVNSNIIQLPNTSSQFDNYYTGSTIYLKSGGASGQIKSIISYSGLDKKILLDSPLDISVSLQISNVQGSFDVGDVVTQNLISMSYLYPVGFFNVGDTIIQTNTGASAVITKANTTTFSLAPNNSTNSFSLSFPIYNTSDSPVLKSGFANTSVGNNWVVAVSNTNFVAEFSAGDYIRVGSVSNTGMRRIISVNSSVIVCDSNTPFSTTMSSNAIYKMASGLTPSSITNVNRSGTISFVNINGQMVTFTNSNPTSGTFIPGEIVKQVDSGGVYQAANAVVAFSNTTAMYLSNVNGNLTANLFLLGQSSNTMVQISTVASFPNITISSPTTTSFALGQNLMVSSQFGTPVGNATLISAVTNPNDMTEYVIGPKVTINGDGTGALAFAEVDTSGNNPSRQITGLHLISQGQNYTWATATITANNIYGSGAVASAAISPIDGHGANSYVELGAKYAGISMTFGNTSAESFRFPVYGSYRKIGIIEGPTYTDATISLTQFDHVKLSISNKNGNNFVTDEVVIQPSTNAAGVVVFSNSTFVELKNVVDTFTANASGDNIYGLHSKAAANTNLAKVAYFQLLSNTEIIKNLTTGATATLVQAVSNTQIRISTIEGHFNVGDRLYDSSTNAYGNVVSITTANGTIDRSTTFGSAFNQTCRLTMSANTGSYVMFETVTQSVTNATGTVVSTNNELNLSITSANGTFSVGDVITDANSGGTALLWYSNNSSGDLRMTGVSGTFLTGHTIKNQLGKTGVVANVYPVLVLSGISGSFQVSNSAVTGANSGATGLVGNIIYPDLQNHSGDVIYLETLIPYARSNTSNEKRNIVIKF